MTASLPNPVREVFERFMTTELVTVGAHQQPIAWPVTPYYRDGSATIDVTTGLGYPKKARDAERHPSVALLFSDSTGSGIEAPPSVLVQGTAEVDDRDLAANRERYIRESQAKLPSASSMYPPRPLRAPLDWYFSRLYVKVRPERTFVWADGDFTAEPAVYSAHKEEVRSGHSEEPPEPHEPAAGGGVEWNPRLDELGTRHSTAVLAWAGPDGFPIAVRLPVAADPSMRRVLLASEPAGVPLAEGRACLTAHAHGAGFEWQENFQVRGDLVRSEGRWALVPHRVLGGFELPPGRIAMLRRNARKAVRFWRTARREKRARSTA